MPLRYNANTTQDSRFLQADLLMCPYDEASVSPSSGRRHHAARDLTSRNITVNVAQPGASFVTSNVLSIDGGYLA